VGYGWGGYPKYTRTPPRAVKGGGIQARATRGDIGETWWSRQWVGALERVTDAARLGRGRSYARRGQVSKLTVTDKGVAAKVQGSRPKPYDVTIELKPIGPKGWERVLDQLSSRASFAASLLAGEVPHDVETAFQAANEHLFPASAKDFSTECSCPDSANPCKHVAAVHYLLAERFDDDPFLLFLLRGLPKEDVLGALRRKRKSPDKDHDSSPEPTRTLAPSTPTLPRPLWEAAEDAGTLRFRMEPPECNALILKALGAPPGWDAQAQRALERAYARASAWALQQARQE